MNIPDEAVKAAAEAYINATRPVGLAEIEAILEAAAPHMLAGAWDEGRESVDFDSCGLNPYRSQT